MPLEDLIVAPSLVEGDTAKSKCFSGCRTGVLLQFYGDAGAGNTCKVINPLSVGK